MLNLVNINFLFENTPFYKILCINIYICFNIMLVDHQLIYCTSICNLNIIRISRIMGMSIVDIFLRHLKLGVIITFRVCLKGS